MSGGDRGGQIRCALWCRTSGLGITRQGKRSGADPAVGFHFQTWVKESASVCVCVCACVCGAREGSCQEKLKSQLNVLQICSTKCESYLTKQVTKKWSRLLISVSQLFRLGWEGAAPESPWQFWADGLIIVEYYSRSWLTVPSRPLIGLDLHINAWVFWRLGGKQGFGFCSGGLSWQLKTSQFCSKSGCFGSEARLWVVMQEN